MASSDGGDFSTSFTDLMTSLAIVFLILSVGMVIVNVLNASEQEEVGKRYFEESGKIAEQKNILLQEIVKQFDLTKLGDALVTNDKCVRVDHSSLFKLVIQFNGANPDCLKTGLFFTENDYFLNIQNTQNNIARLARIYSKICSGSELNNSIEDVQIVGHTDAKTTYLDAESCRRAFGKDKTSEDIVGLARELQCGNMYLSSQRARSVFLLIGEEIRERAGEKLLQCYTMKTQSSGRGPFEQKINPETKEMLSPLDPQQKRVEIVFNFKQPTPHSDVRQ